MQVVQYPNVPPAQASLQAPIPSYVYQQYADDDNIKAFVGAYNAYAQLYITWFNTISLPVYTGTQIFGPLLDWVIEGVYGLPRATLPAGSAHAIGPYNTVTFNQIPFDAYSVSGMQTVFLTTDDVYRRILTWHFYKGDGKQFSIRWLKRRIMRFLYGANGTDYIIDQTYPVSVEFVSAGQVNITLTGVDPILGPILKSGVSSGALELPFQFEFNVVLVNGVILGDPAAYFSTASLITTLPATTGTVWLDGDVFAITSGPAPLGDSAATYFAAAPTTLPTTAGTVWINGGVISITPGPASGGDIYASFLAGLPILLPSAPSVLWINSGALSST